MEQIMNYVKPELIVVAIVLYFCGMALKQTQVVKDKYIPTLRDIRFSIPFRIQRGRISLIKRIM